MESIIILSLRALGAVWSMLMANINKQFFWVDTIKQIYRAKY